MRTKEGQTLHDTWVSGAGRFLRGKGFDTVYVDLPNCAKPPKLNGYIPDVYAIKNKALFPGSSLNVSEVYIVEVETEDSKSTLETLLQHFSLRKWAQDNRAVFEVVIAK